MEKNRNLLDIFKNMPSLKLNKLKMEDIEDIDELKDIDYTKIKSPKEKLKKGEHYPETHYQTIKEVYLHTMEKFPQRTFILDKNHPKDEKFKEYTFREFGDDVEALGTALTKKYHMKDKRIIIIGENQYDWYVSYIATLIGAGLAVPVDKELPENEIENVVNRAKASVVIYSNHLKSKIENLIPKLSDVKYFIEMKSDEALEGKKVGFETVIKEGKELIEKGDDSFLRIEINPEEFKALFFTSRNYF